MARSKLQLSWIGSLRQWRKRFRGKTYYLGTGSGKSDRQSYIRALAKWTAIKAEATQGDRLEQLLSLHDNLQQQLAELAPLMGNVREALSNTKLTKTVAAAESVVQNIDLKPQPTKPNAKTYGDYLNKYLDHCRKRADKTQQMGEQLPKSERLSIGRFGLIKTLSKTITEVLGDLPLIDDEKSLAQALQTFRDYIEQHLLDGQTTASTLSKIIVVLTLPSSVLSVMFCCSVRPHSNPY